MPFENFFAKIKQTDLLSGKRQQPYPIIMYSCLSLTQQQLRDSEYSEMA